MVEDTQQSPNVNEEIDRLKNDLEEETRRIVDPNPNEPTPTGNPPEGNNPPHNEGEGTPPPANPPAPPQYDYDRDYISDGQSHAYGLKNMGDKKNPPSVKHHSGVGKAPQREKSSYKPESSSNFLQACYNEILMPMYAGAINFGVDLTLDLADWILFAPFSSNKAAEDKKDKNKEKTARDYGDEIIAENIQKGKELKLSFLARHKELVDNVKKAKNGQTPIWEAWGGQEPQCFPNLLDVYTKAEADTNSSEAQTWQNFLSLPDKAMREIDNRVTILNFATHHATISLKEADVTPLPPEAPKAFKTMEQMLADPNIDEATLKGNLTREISELRQHLGDNTPANQEIKEKLDELSQILIAPNSTKEQISGKVDELKDVHPMKLKIKENAAIVNQTLLQNLEDIKAQFADNPQQAKQAMQDYVKKVHDTQEIAINRVKDSENASWLKRKKKQKSADYAVTAAKNTINEPPSHPQTHAPLPRQVKDAKDIENIINYVGLQR